MAIAFFCCTDTGQCTQIKDTFFVCLLGKVKLQLQHNLICTSSEEEYKKIMHRNTET